MAGLAAARELVGRKRRVTLLEGRERIGGRIHTVAGAGSLPIELGAEFIHGLQHETWHLVRSARLQTEEIPDRHWTPRQGKLQENFNFWETLAKVTERINTATPDQSVQSFLDQGWSLDAAGKKLLHEYVEGFHAAEAGR